MLRSVQHFKLHERGAINEYRLVSQNETVQPYLNTRRTLIYKARDLWLWIRLYSA